MVEATLRTHRLHDLSHFGLRIVAGVLFMVHSVGKFDSGSSGFFSSIGLPAELGFLIGVLELVGGALLIAGVLTRITRSEEHTSELQSRLHLVCRLLLEKKKSKTSP